MPFYGQREMSLGQGARGKELGERRKGKAVLLWGDENN